MSINAASTSIYENHKDISIAITILIVGLLAGNLLHSFVVENAQASTLFGNTISFIIITATAYGAGFYLFLRFLTPLHKEEDKVHPPYFTLLYQILRITQYTITAILILVILQMVLSLHYYAVLVIVAESLSFTFASIVMALLSYRLISWYRFNRSIVVLLYGLSLCLAAVSTVVIATLNSSIILLEKPSEIGSTSNSGSSDIKYNAISSTLQTFTYMPLRVGFTLYWIATVFLLRNYSKKLGQTKFWFLVSLPLAVYVIANVISIGDYMKQQNVLFRIILYQVGILGSVFFAIIFLTIARASRKNHHNALAQYLTISAYGVVLVAVTLTQPVVNIFYPPFAVIDWGFVGLACYLYSMGFYFSAISISQDTKLRQSVRQLAIRESELLDNIGTAHMEQEIHRKVFRIAKEQEDILKEQTGVEQSIINEEDDMKQYLAEVLEEIEKNRENRNNRSK